jgi:probable DNA metabolism protein
MIQFVYDHTFEGLLSAIFDAYDRRQFPDLLLTTGTSGLLFAHEQHEVITSPEKATRVWNGLCKKLTKEQTNMLLHVWLSEIPDSDTLLFRYIKTVLNAPGRDVVTNFSNADVLQIQKVARAVCKERLYIVQFARFQKSADGLYFAILTPKYNALPLAVSHFVNRFADQIWLLYDAIRHYGYYYDREKVTEITLDDDNLLLSREISPDLLDKQELLFQEMWQDYFKTICIRERINPRLHRQNMPRRFWKYLIEKK